MRLELTGRHLDVTAALRRLVTTKITKLERMLNDSAVSAHVVLAREKHRHLTEITLHASGEKFLHATGAATSWELSLGDAMEKLAHQAQTLKGKRQPWKGRRAKAQLPGPIEQPEAVNVAPAGSPRARPRMPKTMQTTRQAVKTMTVPEAARAIDGSRDGILVFLDPETRSINVMYRRPNGDLTLVEIEL
jgi:putative sigma-54 modulation protein